ncbi:MAG: DUF3108 domain-containing protein [Pseudomonadota bacterium]
MIGTALLTAASAMTVSAAADYPAFNTEKWKSLFAVDVAPANYSVTPIPYPNGATTYSVTFKGEIAGIHVGRLFLDIASSPNGYDVGYRMEQHGIARWFSDAEAKTNARGTFKGTTVDSHYYFNHDYERDDDQQYVELYRPSGSPRIRLWTDPQYHFYEPVSESLADGALDPMGALMSLAFTAVAEGKSPCDRTVKVLDGRRRFDLRMIDNGTERIRKGGKGRFSGIAHKCKLEQQKIAGYREKDKGDIDGDLWVYLSEVPKAYRSETFAYVPVMVIAKRGILSARLEGKNPTITTADGRSINLGLKKR